MGGNSTVYYSEVTIDKYSVVRKDRNRNGRGVTCYIRSNIYYSRKTCLPGNFENIFTDLLFPKTKPISVGIICMSLNQAQFLGQEIAEFQALLNDELSIFGHFNIILLFKDKWNFNKTHETDKYGFKQLTILTYFNKYSW